MSKSPYAQAMETILQHHLQLLVSLFTPEWLLFRWLDRQTKLEGGEEAGGGEGDHNMLVQNPEHALK